MCFSCFCSGYNYSKCNSCGAGYLRKRTDFVLCGWFRCIDIFIYDWKLVVNGCNDTKHHCNYRWRIQCHSYRRKWMRISIFGSDSGECILESFSSIHNCGWCYNYLPGIICNPYIFLYKRKYLVNRRNYSKH